MSKINIDGIILDDEQQTQLFGFIESYIYGLKKKAAEDLALGEILVTCADTLKINKSYVKKAADTIYKLDSGKLNLQQKNDAEAAIEQCMEIYDAKKGA